MNVQEAVRQLSSYFQLNKESYGPIINVKAFGAKGDGSTDDRVAIQRAADAVRLSPNKNILYFPPGTYLCSVAAGPGGYLTAFYIGGNTVVMGAGRTASAIKLKASQAQGNQLLMNYNVGSVIDENITIRDITFDGNGANQPAVTTNANRGILFFRARHIIFDNVLVKNVKGVDAGSTSTGESFDIQVSLCADVTHRNCVCQGISTSSSGFTCDSTTDTVYIACESYDHGIGHGFTNAGCQGVAYHGCTSYGNTAGNGFNTENSAYVVYHGCLAGGISPATVGWYGANTTRPNSSGFVVLGTGGTAGPTNFVGCSSNRNTSDGIYINGGTNVKIVGGDFADNGAMGSTWPARPTRAWPSPDDPT
jgi:hypothetical protein